MCQVVLNLALPGSESGWGSYMLSRLPKEHFGCRTVAAFLCDASYLIRFFSIWAPLNHSFLLEAAKFKCHAFLLRVHGVGLIRLLNARLGRGGPSSESEKKMAYV